MMRVSPDELKHLMRLSFFEALQKPHLAVEYLLDHQHTSYAHDLRVCALSELRHERQQYN